MNTNLRTLKNMESKFITIRQLEKYIPYKMSTIYAFVRKNRIPFHKPRGKLIFNKDEIDAWIKNGFELQTELKEPILFKNYKNGKR